MQVIIKAFNEQTACNSPEELKRTLEQSYAGKHVTIEQTSPRGTKKNTFITVSHDGKRIQDTYSQKPVKNLECFFNTTNDAKPNN